MSRPLKTTKPSPITGRPIGKPRKWPTPEHLWDAWLDYVEWARANPRTVQRPMNAGGKIHYATVEHPRPLTIAGFLTRTSSTRELWSHYESSPEYVDVVARIHEEIAADIHEGALGGIYDGRYAARLMGLAERRVEERHDVAAGINKASDEELLRELQERRERVLALQQQRIIEADARVMEADQEVDGHSDG